MDADQVNELIERTKAESLDRRRAAAQELRALLLREGKPGKDDHARLLEVAGALGLQAEQLPEVLEIVTKLERYDRLLSEEGERLAEHKRAHVALKEFDDAVEAARAKAFDEAAEKRLPIAAEENRIGARIAELEEPRRWRSTVAAKWSAIVEGISHEEAFNHRSFDQANPPGKAHRGAGAPAVQAPHIG
jgi:hypothetical protein